MDTGFEVGTRPADGVCPDCGRVIRDGVWFRHRQVAHGTLSLAPSTGPVDADAEPSIDAEAPDAPVLGLRPADSGVCPDCGRRVAVDLLDNHRTHVHGAVSPGREAGRPGRGRPGGGGAGATTPPTVSNRPRTTVPVDRSGEQQVDPKRAAFTATLGFAVAALVCFVIYIGDITSWTASSQSCQVVGRHHRATTPTTGPSCGFYALAASLQTVVLVLGIVALVLAVIAPLVSASSRSEE